MENTGAMPLTLSILVVDDEPTIRKTLGISLEAEGHHVTAVSNAEDAMVEATRRYFDMALVDLRLGTASGMDLIAELRTTCPWIKSVVITAYASVGSAVEAMRRGAFDYLPKPFTHDQVAVLAQKVAEIRKLEQKVESLQETLSEFAPEVDLTSRTPAMRQMFSMARQVADSEATILIRGENGSGKTVLARAIHSWSRRASKPFGMVSCPSLSPELLESQLFGHVKGAFTGAVHDSPGLLTACDGGTLFLDEIGDLPLSIQAKLLRVIQEKAYERVGDVETRKADVRIITATNVDLEAAVSARQFREDLFYRLNVVEIVIPPLRERREDILPIAERLLGLFIKQNHRRPMDFTEEARETLINYVWPGNLRELRNAVERAVLLCNEDSIRMQHLQLKLAPVAPPPNLGDRISLDKVEEIHIRRVLAYAKSIQEACEILGMDTVTLWRRRKKYGI